LHSRCRWLRDGFLFGDKFEKAKGNGRIVEAGSAFVRYNETARAVELHARNTPAAQPQPHNADGTFSSVSMDAELAAATKASNKYGFAPHTAITGCLTFGYQIPPAESNVAELVAGLKLARKGNLRQAQVDAIIVKSNV
jgi:hypothetical protein